MLDLKLFQKKFDQKPLATVVAHPFQKTACPQLFKKSLIKNLLRKG